MFLHSIGYVHFLIIINSVPNYIMNNIIIKNDWVNV